MALVFEKGLKEATEKLLEFAQTLPTPIVLIDGRAGSGKSLFASRLADAYFQEQRQAARIVHLDDLYPGWEGLMSGSVYAREKILEPISNGKTASWQIWDWASGQRGSSEEIGNGFREFGGSTALILEGCGALSKASAELASLKIWLDSDERLRRQRFSARDGGKYDEFWGIWAAQEDEFYASEKSKELAELIIQN